jgi:hypothetical protein
MLIIAIYTAYADSAAQEAALDAQQELALKELALLEEDLNTPDSLFDLGMTALTDPDTFSEYIDNLGGSVGSLFNTLVSAASSSFGPLLAGAAAIWWFFLRDTGDEQVVPGGEHYV